MNGRLTWRTSTFLSLGMSSPITHLDHISSAPLCISMSPDTLKPLRKSPVCMHGYMNVGPMPACLIWYHFIIIPI